MSRAWSPCVSPPRQHRQHRTRCQFPAAAAPPERTPEEKVERARVQAERERRELIEARRLRDPRIRAAMTELPSARLSDALHFWTQSTASLLAMATGVERRNMDGSPAGAPMEDQQAFTREVPRKRGKWPAEEVQKGAETLGAGE